MTGNAAVARMVRFIPCIPIGRHPDSHGRALKTASDSAQWNRTAPSGLPAMDISWRDLADVREPGDHPFRDGTITVTFAEIAIWQERPDARFMLMRKYPLRAQARYALGRRFDQGPVNTAEDEPIYMSANGGLLVLGQRSHFRRRVACVTGQTIRRAGRCRISGLTNSFVKTRAVRNTRRSGN